LKPLQTLIKGVALIVIISIIVFNQSCEEPDLVGMEIQPPQDKLGLNISDTTTAIAWTFTEDSVVSDELPTNLLGHYVDPVFGTTKAAFFAQPRLSSNDVTFGSGAVADSIILSLVYDGFYGDETAPLKITVYEADSTYYRDSVYYSDQSIAVLPVKLYEEILTPKPEDSVEVDGEMLVPQMRLKLSQSFADNILNAGDANLADNDAFLDFFKGLYITAEAQSVNGSILYFDLANSLSKLTLHYHNSNDTSTYNFVINENSTTINTFDHNNYTDASIDLYNQINGDTLLGKQKLYIQAMAGTRIKLYFPYLQNWAKNQRIAVNKAVLYLPVDESGTSIDDFEPPDQLGLVKLNEEGNANFLSDYLLGTGYFGGTYNEGKKAYEFNIAKHIQDIIDGNETDYGLNLLANLRQVTANRVVLKGVDNNDGNLKLVITYTILD
jgi:hypothetical protein